MKERKVVYFEEVGKNNTDDALNAALERLKDGDIKHVIVASNSGGTAMKAADKFKGVDINLVSVGLSAGSSFDKTGEWDKNVKKLEKMGVKPYRGIHALSGVERAVKARWGTAGPVLLMADALRTISEGVKVGIEIMISAVDGGMVPEKENVMTIAGTSRGADTCMIVKSVKSSDFFGLAIREIVCKPYTDGVKHEAR
jgi:hypothetical protein